MKIIYKEQITEKRSEGMVAKKMEIKLEYGMPLLFGEEITTTKKKAARETK